LHLLSREKDGEFYGIDTDSTDEEVVTDDDNDGDDDDLSMLCCQTQERDIERPPF
jgi:hypothetical protein